MVKRILLKIRRDFEKKILKPIFHCDVKTLALGPCVGLDPQHKIWHWMMVSKKC